MSTQGYYTNADRSLGICDTGPQSDDYSSYSGDLAMQAHG